MSDDLESELRNYAETADYHTDAVFFAKASDHIRSQRELIQEMREALKPFGVDGDVLVMSDKLNDYFEQADFYRAWAILSKAKSQQEGETE